jgi:hypothetical protein
MLRRRDTAEILALHTADCQGFSVWAAIGAYVPGREPIAECP